MTTVRIRPLAARGTAWITTEVTEVTEGNKLGGKAGQSDPLTGDVIGAAIEIHRHLGPGLLESAYCECLAYEFSKRGINFEREVSLPVRYKEVKLDCGYRLDFLVEEQVVVEVKSVEALGAIHQAQLLSYLKLGGHRLGLLINFNVPVLREGIKRLVQD